MIDLIKRDLNHYVQMLLRNEPFALARYGDGEFAAMFGEEGENCDGHHYFPEMGEALTETFKYPKRGNYEYGILDVSYINFGRDKVFSFLDEIIGNSNILLTDGDAMVIASKTGNLFPIVSVLREKKILYVGPRYLHESDLGKMFNYYIDVPTKDSWLAIGDIMSKIRTECRRNQYDLIGFSAGPPTKIMMWRLWDKVVPKTTMIDFGSLWDGFINKPTRRYHSESKWKMLINKNLFGV